MPSRSVQTQLEHSSATTQLQNYTVAATSHHAARKHQRNYAAMLLRVGRFDWIQSQDCESDWLAAGTHIPEPACSRTYNLQICMSTMVKKRGRSCASQLSSCTNAAACHHAACNHSASTTAQLHSYRNTMLHLRAITQRANTCTTAPHLSRYVWIQRRRELPWT